MVIDHTKRNEYLNEANDKFREVLEREDVSSQLHAMALGFQWLIKAMEAESH